MNNVRTSRIQQHSSVMTSLSRRASGLCVLEQQGAHLKPMVTQGEDAAGVCQAQGVSVGGSNAGCGFPVRNSLREPDTRWSRAVHGKLHHHDDAAAVRGDALRYLPSSARVHAMLQDA
jgi:hypothetical protein